MGGVVLCSQLITHIEHMKIHYFTAVVPKSNAPFDF